MELEMHMKWTYRHTFFPSSISSHLLNSWCWNGRPWQLDETKPEWGPDSAIDQLINIISPGTREALHRKAISHLRRYSSIIQAEFTSPWGLLPFIYWIKQVKHGLLIYLPWAKLGCEKSFLRITNIKDFGSVMCAILFILPRIWYIS